MFHPVMVIGSPLDGLVVGKWAVLTVSRESRLGISDGRPEVRLGGTVAAVAGMTPPPGSTKTLVSRLVVLVVCLFSWLGGCGLGGACGVDGAVVDLCSVLVRNLLTGRLGLICCLIGL